MSARRRFLVLSHDAHEGQTFWDFVLAVTKEKAEEFVAGQRGHYAQVIDSIGTAELNGVATRLWTAHDPNIIDGMKALVKENR